MNQRAICVFLRPGGSNSTLVGGGGATIDLIPLPKVDLRNNIIVVKMLGRLKPPSPPACSAGPVSKRLPTMHFD